MWPTLVAGDLVRAETASAADLGSGDILVLPGTDGDNVIHRIERIRNTERGILLFTVGDRSGTDTPGRPLPDGSEPMRVTGVLRRGKWKVPRERPCGLVRSLPGIVVRVHSWMIGRLQHSSRRT